MKFILNKCKVIQLGKYNLTPWRLGERHLESSNTESGLRDSKLHWDLRYMMVGCGTGYRQLSGSAEQADWEVFCFPAWAVATCYTTTVC